MSNLLLLLLCVSKRWEQSLLIHVIYITGHTSDSPHGEWRQADRQEDISQSMAMLET